MASDAGPTALLFGGEDSESVGVDGTWSWDGTQWTQILVAEPPLRWGGMMASLNGVIVLFGGLGSATQTDLSDTWTFDGTRWTQLSVDGPPARDSGMFAQLAGQLVLYGGEEVDLERNDGHNFDDTWTFDGTKWTKLDVVGTGGLNSSAMASFGGNLVLFGGQACNASESMNFECTDRGNTWTFDGTAWTQLDVVGPTARSDSAMATWGASGGSGGTLVLYGGSTSSVIGESCGGFDDTWTWDGTAWSQLAVSGPGYRASASMVGFNNTLVLFGGWTTQASYEAGVCSYPAQSDTWTWNGTAWSALSVLGPSPRDGLSFAAL